MKFTFLFAAMLVATALHASEPVLPAWGLVDGSYAGAAVFTDLKAELAGDKAIFIFQYRPVNCTPVKINNPLCTFEFMEYRNGAEVISTDEKNGLNCARSDYIILRSSEKSQRIFDSKEGFVSYMKKVNTYVKVVAGRNVRGSKEYVSHPDCVTVE